MPISTFGPGVTSDLIKPSTAGGREGVTGVAVPGAADVALVGVAESTGEAEVSTRVARLAGAIAVCVGAGVKEI